MNFEYSSHSFPDRLCWYERSTTIKRNKDSIVELQHKSNRKHRFGKYLIKHSGVTQRWPQTSWAYFPADKAHPGDGVYLPHPPLSPPGLPKKQNAPLIFLPSFPSRMSCSTSFVSIAFAHFPGMASTPSQCAVASMPPFRQMACRRP